MDNKIKAIIFDYGRVLVNVNINNFIPKDHPFQSMKEDDLYKKIDRDKKVVLYETGKISTPDFTKYINELLGTDFNDSQLWEKWNLMIGGPVDGMIPLLESLSQEYPLYVLSNLSPPHYDNAMKNHKFLSIFKKFYASFEIGLLKPDHAIYKYVSQDINIPPENLIFVDDRPENVEGANQVGFHGIHFTDIESLKKELNNLLPFAI